MFRTVQAFFLAVLAFANPTAHAHPETPFEVSMGENPSRTFGGSIVGGEREKVFTVPVGKDFIITTVRVNGTRVRFHDGPTDTAEHIMFGGEHLGFNQGNGFSRGNARLQIASGEELWVRNMDSCCSDASYLIEGYFVEPGGPYRSRWSPWDEGVAFDSVVTVFSATEGRDFMVTMFLMEQTQCDVLVDGVLKIPGLTWSTQTYGDDSAASYWTGNGRLVVPADSDLQVRGDGAVCSYYLEGRYIGR